MQHNVANLLAPVKMGIMFACAQFTAVPDLDEMDARFFIGGGLSLVGVIGVGFPSVGVAGIFCTTGIDDDLSPWSAVKCELKTILVLEVTVC